MTVPSLCLVVVALLLGLGPDYGFAAPAGTAENRKLRVGAFNIQTFGRTKMSREAVAEQIKQIVERYDVLLIQEIRDKSVESVRQLLGMLDLPFDFVISDPIGRSSYKEQYAYFYRTDRVLLLGTYQYEDPDDVFEREPFVASVAPKFSNHDAVSLIGLHAKPSEATDEIGHLKDVVARTVEEFEKAEPIVLGDLNADCSYANLDKRLEANDYLTTTTDTYDWLINEDADTTTRASTDCAYDRIIVRRQLKTHVVSGSAAAFDYQEWLGISDEEALAVSDHYPVEMLLQF